MIHKFRSEDVVVLIVDDDPDTSRLLVDLVNTMGGTALTASEGSEGLRVAHEHLPTAVICDYHMEPVDGGSFLAGLRHSSVWRVAKIPVIMFTAENDQTSVKKLSELGATDYLVKPFSPKGLSERLADVVQVNRLFGFP